MGDREVNGKEVGCEEEEEVQVMKHIPKLVSKEQLHSIEHAT